MLLENQKGRWRRLDYHYPCLGACGNVWCVLVAGPYSGAHLNPALSVGLAVAGKFPGHLWFLI